MTLQTTSHWQRWFVEADCLAAREDFSSPTPVLLYWLAIEGYLEYLCSLVLSHGLIKNEALHQLIHGFTARSDGGRPIPVVTRLFEISNLHSSIPKKLSDQPWEDANLLNELRNCISHTSPTILVIGVGQQTQNFKQVRSRHRKLFCQLRKAGLILGENDINRPDWYEMSSAINYHKWARKAALSVFDCVQSSISDSTPELKYMSKAISHQYLEGNLGSVGAHNR